MAVPAWLLGLFQPVADLVDNLHTSKEEKLQIDLAMTGALSDAAQRVMEYETKLAEAQSKIIIAEAQGTSWLQRNWRPLTMLTFVFIIAWNYIVSPIFAWAFGAAIPVLTLPPGLWTTIQIGLGGYIAARSGEKITTAIVNRNK